MSQFHQKKNQLLKYLNKESTCTNATFIAIPSVVLNRLAKITSRTDANSKLRVKKYYPDHAMQLTKAGLNMRTCLFLGLFWVKLYEGRIR